MPNSPDNSQLPTANAIQGTLQSGASPLDFIKKNLRPDAPVQGGSTEVISNNNALAHTTPTSVEPSFAGDPNFPIVPEPVPLVPPVEPKKEDPPKEEEEKKLEESNEPPVEIEEDREGPKKSLKDLRKIVNETSTQLQTAQEELEQTKSELERYRTGEAVPEKIKEYEERIGQLEHYEQLHAFKSSRAYRKKFTEPLEALKDKARTVAQDYGVNTQVFDQALRIDNKKDLNSFLRKHFDDVGTLEAREVVLKIRDLADEMDAAEENNREALTKIENDLRIEEQQSAEQRIQRLNKVARVGWFDALKDLRDSEEFPELVIKENNADHNKISKPILEGASRELAHFMQMLAEAGINELPAKAAKVLAKRFALSQAASVIAQSRAEHHERAEEIAKASQQIAPYLRPPVGGGTVNGAGPRPKENFMTPEKAAKELLNSTLNKR